MTEDVHLGSNLIFILSQPRTGSTLLSRMLSGHSKIDACGETRILQAALMPMAKRWTEEDSLELKHSRQDMNIFLDELPDGKEVYYEGMRRMFGHIYAERLKASRKVYFLDKTPRYAYFIPELYRIFPKAKYIFLFRHPLAVLSSIVRNWTDYKRPFPNDDLELVPSLLLEGLELLGKEAYRVQYEDLVSQPEAILRLIAEHLNVPFEDQIINYNQKGEKWATGDRFIYDHSRPTDMQAAAWRVELGKSEVWKYSNEYLGMLGKNTVTAMGYDYTEALDALSKMKPSLLKRLRG